MLAKTHPIRSKHITSAARGEPCCVRIAGVCNYDETTTIFAHLPDESHGMARKSDDLIGAFSCSACHDAIDGRAWSLEFEDHRERYMRRAMARTWRRLVEMGVISVKGIKQ